MDSSDRRGCTFSCDLLLSSTSPNNNTHPLLNIEKNEARFACLPLVHLQGIEEHHRGVEFTLCHSYSPGRLCRALALPKDLWRNGRSTSLNSMLKHFYKGKTPGIGTIGRHNKLRGFYLSSQIVKNLSTQTDCSGGLVLIILRSDAN